MAMSSVATIATSRMLFAMLFLSPFQALPLLLRGLSSLAFPRLSMIQEQEAKALQEKEEAQRKAAEEAQKKIKEGRPFSLCLPAALQ